MTRLKSRRILLCLTGSIAAYKSAELVRLLVQAQAQVRVAMTASACEFISPLTLQALSSHPVHTQLLDPQAEIGMGHIELARWAQLVVIAPASAHCLARLAHGLADDLVATLCLATQAPLAVVPAMNEKMFLHAATQMNLKLLAERGVMIWGPDQGQQACGDTGLGRMLEPSVLVEYCHQHFVPQCLHGHRVIITAGPTYEAIDPVRFIGNHSSGKMGFALAKAAIERGATVILIAGPCALDTPSGVTRINVTSAQEMYDAVFQQLSGCDLFIGCAAVADYRLANPWTQKLKKNMDDELSLRLVPNPDIIKEVATSKGAPFCVGFAAETQQVAAYAKAKLAHKKLDMIIANQVAYPDCGFCTDDNAVTLFSHDKAFTFPKTPKAILAYQLIDVITEHYQAHEKIN